jgi:dienelactone hydrolase
MLRRLPVFGVFGDGTYKLQPIHVDDLAAAAVERAADRRDAVVEAIGPETFTYRGLVETIKRALGLRRLVVRVPPGLGYRASRLIGLLVKDVVLTREEVRGATAGSIHGLSVQLTMGRRVTGSVALALALALAGLGAGHAAHGASDPAYRTFEPQGPGAHPAAVFLSGCSGLAPSIAPTFYERTAERLRARGYLVVFADYLGRRGLSSCATGGLSYADAADDLVGAAAWLRARPDVDPSRIVAFGWSYGGAGVLTALARHPGGLGVSRAVVYYPVCRGVAPWKAATPVLMLLGGDDDVAPAALCEGLVRARPAPPAVRIVVYPGARHGFDVPELPARMKYGFGTLGHDPAAAAAAWREVERFVSGTAP